MYDKDEIKEKIIKIRKEIGHDYVQPEIKDMYYNKGELTIITPDRPEKSIIIGKGGWVVGKLKEEINLKSIHVISYTDIILKEYQLKLALKHLKKQEIPDKYTQPFFNLYDLLKEKQQHPYDNTIISKYIKKNINSQVEPDAKITVALSGGVDSSFSTLLSRALGFNIHTITVNPGTIILPKQFQNNINTLVKNLNIKHEYLETNMNTIISEALKGKIHPCGRCSSHIEDIILNKTRELNIPYVIYGDLLSTGSQSIIQQNNITRINMPALFRMEKTEIKNIITDHSIKKIKGYGCPLIVQVHHKYPQYRIFSIQRVLRETRAGILEPGEALDLINTI